MRLLTDVAIYVLLYIDLDFLGQINTLLSFWFCVTVCVPWISGRTGVGRRCCGWRSVLDHRDGYSEERWFRRRCRCGSTAVPRCRSFAHFRDWRVSSGRFAEDWYVYLTTSVLHPCHVLTSEYCIPSDFVVTALLEIKISAVQLNFSNRSHVYAESRIMYKEHKPQIEHCQWLVTNLYCSFYLIIDVFW